MDIHISQLRAQDLYVLTWLKIVSSLSCIINYKAILNTNRIKRSNYCTAGNEKNCKACKSEISLSNVWNEQLRKLAEMWKWWEKTNKYAQKTVKKKKRLLPKTVKTFSVFFLILTQIFPVGMTIILVSRPPFAYYKNADSIFYWICFINLFANHFYVWRWMLSYNCILLLISWVLAITNILWQVLQ